MASKQKQTDQPRNGSSVSQKVIPHPLVLMNVSLNYEKADALRNLRRNHPGVADVAQYYVQDNDGQWIPAVRIDMKSEDLAKELIKNNRIVIEKIEYSVATVEQAVIAMKVSSNVSVQNLLRDLSHNYTGIEKVSRFSDADYNPVDCIHVNLKTASSLTQLLKEKNIFVDGKRSPIQPCWSLVVSMQKPTTVDESNHVTEKPKQVVQTPRSVALTEHRVKQLFAEHEHELNVMMCEFEAKWNARLSQMTSSSHHSGVDQLAPILKDLSYVCQQFSHQNSETQTRLNTVLRRSQNIQMSLNRDAEYPLLPSQNGH